MCTSAAPAAAAGAGGAAVGEAAVAMAASRRRGREAVESPLQAILSVAVGLLVRVAGKRLQDL